MRMKSQGMLLFLFLMHRVELKENSKLVFISRDHVPNAPCGVESPETVRVSFLNLPFLMHRVELKVPCDG